jgi:hypothetical protein
VENAIDVECNVALECGNLCLQTWPHDSLRNIKKKMFLDKI